MHGSSLRFDIQLDEPDVNRAACALQDAAVAYAKAVDGDCLTANLAYATLLRAARGYAAAILGVKS